VKQVKIYFSVFVVCLASLSPIVVFGQRLGFLTSTPRIDSFPLVRLKVTTTYNGSLPQPGILPSDMKIKEDNAPVNNFQVTDCDESGQAAIVFCLDVSTSIKSSAGDSWDVYKAYFSSFDKFIPAIPSSSRYALVAFTDSVYYYPGPGHVNGFYTGQNSADSASFQLSLRAQSFAGFTDVEYAIRYSAGLLQYAPFQQKAIVLVTDDAIINTPHFDSLLNSMGITLYVMELGKGSPTLNSEVAHSTGGTFIPATDSAQFTPVMGQIAEYVFGEHCIIRYPSTNPCPWLKLHNIDLTLNYKGLSRSNIEQYVLGRNIFDTAPPLFAVATPIFTSRVVSATENFPCTRGIKDFQDSSLKNFIKLSQVRKFPDFVSDSLIVGDSLQPARGVYTMRDSANNYASREVLYVPKADTFPPVISGGQPLKGNYEMIVTEDRSWDRGIKNISLKPGAINLVLDSFQISSRHFALAWLHTPNLKAEAKGCLDAFDSVGNIGTNCILRDSAAGDTLAPIITQDPIFSPRRFITGTVTEERFKDVGIQNITIPSAPNSGTPTITYQSSSKAVFSLPIIDSLQPVRRPIFAYDSLGNEARDSLRYDPLPDLTAPVCSIVTPDPKIRIFQASELAPWDRGISSVALVGTAQNLTVGVVIYKNVYQVEQQFTVIDPFTLATAVIQVFDSAGHSCETTISIDPLTKPLVPFTSTTPVDFGTVYAPANISKQVQITNPNESPVIVTKITQTGDVVFSSDMTTPIIFKPFETKTFNISFDPTLLGVWNGNFVLANDTMNLTSLSATGRSIGSVQINIGTAQVPKSQALGNFIVSIAATPAPINLDSISFVLSYDSDLVDIQYQNSTGPDCSSGNNPLCNYSFSLSKVSPGKASCLLIRKDQNLNNTLDFSTSTFSIPFLCFVSQSDTTSVLAENIFVSQLSTASFTPGRISVLSECGDQTLRALLNNTLPVWLQSVAPNPAANNVAVSIASKEKVTTTISIIDNLGQIQLHKELNLDPGLNIKNLDLSKLSNGSYQLLLSSPSGNISTQLLEIVR